MKAHKGKPVSLADRVAKSRDRAIKAGARRMPTGLLPAEAAEALDGLLSDGYAKGSVACIARALIEARKSK